MKVCRMSSIYSYSTDSASSATSTIEIPVSVPQPCGTARLLAVVRGELNAYLEHGAMEGLILAIDPSWIGSDPVRDASQVRVVVL